MLKSFERLTGSDQHFGATKNNRAEASTWLLNIGRSTAGPDRLNFRHPDRLGRAHHCKLYLIGAEHGALSGLKKIPIGFVGHSRHKCQNYC
jgi:hypothetical protein